MNTTADLIIRCRNLSEDQIKTIGSIAEHKDLGLTEAKYLSYELKDNNMENALIARIKELASESCHYDTLRSGGSIDNTKKITALLNYLDQLYSSGEEKLIALFNFLPNKKIKHILPQDFKFFSTVLLNTEAIDLNPIGLSVSEYEKIIQKIKILYELATNTNNEVKGFDKIVDKFFEKFILCTKNQESLHNFYKSLQDDNIQFKEKLAKFILIKIGCGNSLNQLLQTEVKV